MQTIQLPLPPVGVKIFSTLPAWAEAVDVYHGISYCRAVSEATAGRELILKQASIETCRWAPVVLGLSPAEQEFEKSLAPRLPLDTKGIYLASLDKFRDEIDPDVVLVRCAPETIHDLIEQVGWNEAAWESVERKKLSASALRVVRERNHDWRSRLVRPVNMGLAAMRKAPGWTKATTMAFKSRGVTIAFDRLIKWALADMSMCRNSTVIPFLTGKINASFFCTGGIAWGENNPRHLTSGWPWPLWRKIDSKLTW